MRTTDSTAPRLDRLLRERVHDPYLNKHKPPEPSVCRTCKVIFREGRWQRADHWPEDAHRVLCPACQRTRDNYPAGIIMLKGRFVPEHKDEMAALARHLEAEENRSHVLHRIMAMEDTPDGMIIKTTDLHLPRRIGEAIHRAFKGDLALRYDEDGCLLRVTWSRE